MPHAQFTRTKKDKGKKIKCLVTERGCWKLTGDIVIACVLFIPNRMNIPTARADLVLDLLNRNPAVTTRNQQLKRTPSQLWQSCNLSDKKYNHLPKLQSVTPFILNLTERPCPHYVDDSIISTSVAAGLEQQYTAKLKMEAEERCKQY